MFTKEKIEEIINAELAADSYSLGAHWVYDEKQLSALPINWDTLNAPQAMWHKGKSAGDFTHIGDQFHWFSKFAQENESFDSTTYLKFWQNKMSTYDGYIDGATRETLANLEEENFIGSNSDDFSVIGRISPLLLLSKDEDDFLQNVQSLVKCSHNSEKVLSAASFFAKLLLSVQDGKNIEESIVSLKDGFDDFVKENVEKGLASKGTNSFDTIREFGPACGVDEGFAGIVHLLVSYPTNLKELLVQNAKAGGDTSSRAMVATMIFVANSSSSDIPKDWFEVNAK